jgi:D-amino-acid dehydrogenase
MITGMKQTVIIGGGLIGLSTAFALHQRGVPNITVIESGPGAHGASVVNAGWIVPAHSDPVPAPGLVRQSLRWMTKSDSPLYIKPGAMADPQFAKWMYQFWRACNETNYRHAIASMAALNTHTFALFDAYKAVGVEFEMHASGLVCAFLSAANLERELDHLTHYKDLGLNVPEVKWGRGAQELEPALSSNVNGAFQIQSERHIRPESLTDGLTNWLRTAGVTIQTNTTVVGIDMAAGSVQAVEATSGRFETDHVVIAAGARSAAIARMAGVTIPLQGGKGYSIDYADPPTKPAHPISVYESHMAITPTEAYTRLAGTMELSGINSVVRSERVAALARGARLFLRGWSGEVGDGVVGSGLRPMTPDGMPIIGMAPGYRNLAISTGHQMLGLTLAPASAHYLGALVTTAEPQPVLEPFRAERFT